MKLINKKLDWLNINLNNRFFISVNDETNKFNIRDKDKVFDVENLSKYMLNKELDNLEYMLGSGQIDKIDKLYNKINNYSNWKQYTK